MLGALVTPLTTIRQPGHTTQCRGNWSRLFHALSRCAISARNQSTRSGAGHVAVHRSSLGSTSLGGSAQSSDAPSGGRRLQRAHVETTLARTAASAGHVARSCPASRGSGVRHHCKSEAAADTSLPRSLSAASCTNLGPIAHTSPAAPRPAADPGAHSNLGLYASAPLFHKSCVTHGYLQTILNCVYDSSHGAANRCTASSSWGADKRGLAAF